MAGKSEREVMMVTGGNWQSELESAIQAAQRAGQILQEWAGKFTVQNKGLNDLVTEADHAAQKAIHEHLARRFPSDQFLEEEGERNLDPNAKRRWIIDPLDGTTNYVHGLPLYCVSIALEVEGELVVGVLYDPNRKECFAAAKGQGAKCNGAVIQVSRSAKLVQGLLCIGFPADILQNPSAPDIFHVMSKRARSVRRLGSAAIALGYIAAGRLDGYFAKTLNPWDAAAGIVLIREAGGLCTNLDGTPYNLYTPDIVASNGLIHAGLVESIASADKKQVE